MAGKLEGEMRSEVCVRNENTGNSKGVSEGSEIEARNGCVEITRTSDKGRVGKKSKCKICRAEFVKRSSAHKICGPDCAESLVEIEKANQARKQQRKEMMAHREKLEKLKNLNYYKKKAQIAVNAYVRLRDFGKPCISCGKILALNGKIGGDYDAGHYLSVGSSPNLRFDLRNIHGQCVSCNRFKEGNRVAYRIGLIERFGIQFVEEIEADKKPRKYDRNALIEIESEAKRMLKCLKKKI